jgi:hypothetical protein
MSSNIIAEGDYPVTILAVSEKYGDQVSAPVTIHVSMQVKPSTLTTSVTSTPLAALTFPKQVSTIDLNLELVIAATIVGALGAAIWFARRRHATKGNKTQDERRHSRPLSE